MEKRNDDINLTYENLDTRDFFEMQIFLYDNIPFHYL